MRSVVGVMWCGFWLYVAWPFLFLLCVFGEGASFWHFFALLPGNSLVLLHRSGG